MNDNFKNSVWSKIVKESEDFYNPVVKVRFPLEPTAPSAFFYMETTFEELFIDNPWLKDYQEEIESALKQYGSYYPENYDLKISIA